MKCKIQYPWFAIAHSTAWSVYYASQARTAPGERSLGVQSVLENCSHVLREQALIPGTVFLPKSEVWLLGDSLVEKLWTV